MRVPEDPARAVAERLAEAVVVGADVDELDLALRLTRLTRLHAVALEELLRSVGLTTAEAVVLTALSAAAPDHVLSPTALQGMVVQTPGGVTKTLRRLESAGLVERRTDPLDRRALLASLTAEGLERAREVLQTSAAFHRALFAPLSEGQRGALTDAASALLTALESRMGAR